VELEKGHGREEGMGENVEGIEVRIPKRIKLCTF
jgi:hypothetical protein